MGLLGPLYLLNKNLILNGGGNVLPAPQGEGSYYAAPFLLDFWRFLSFPHRQFKRTNGRWPKGKATSSGEFAIRLP